MTWELISATPSPYARKVRIALQEKNLPFELKTEVPWDKTTQTPQYNPLEKLPVLVFNNGKPAVYESSYILEWLETKYPEPSLLPSMKDADDRLLVKQIEVVVDGICDALVLSFFEKQRDEDKQSKPWTDRYEIMLIS
jgi:glutathione S-transferase